MRDAQPLKVLSFATGLLLVAALFGCATPYQSMGFAGGYYSSPLSENTYEVHFSGNGWTSLATVQSYAAHRAEELCSEKGFTDYEILSGQHTTAQTSSGGGTTCTTSGTVNSNSYNAETSCAPKKVTTINKHDAYVTVRCGQDILKPDDAVLSDNTPAKAVIVPDGTYMLVAIHSKGTVQRINEGYRLTVTNTGNGKVKFSGRGVIQTGDNIIGDCRIREFSSVLNAKGGAIETRRTQEKCTVSMNQNDFENAKRYLEVSDAGKTLNMYAESNRHWIGLEFKHLDGALTH